VYKLKKNLILTGMMGVGKSTLGKILSKELDMTFGDVDKIIEKKLSLSISEIFKIKGERFFRQIEEIESLKLIKKKNLIIALGGGAFINKKIRKHIKKFSISIWLDLSSENIYQRVNRSKRRPLLSNIKNREDIETIYKERRKIYSKADYKINCNGKKKGEVVKKIKEIYENIKN